jgi:hypothetical protein
VLHLQIREDIPIRHRGLLQHRHDCAQLARGAVGTRLPGLVLGEGQLDFAVLILGPNLAKAQKVGQVDTERPLSGAKVCIKSSLFPCNYAFCLDSTALSYETKTPLSWSGRKKAL